MRFMEHSLLVKSLDGILQHPGDKLTAEVTKSGRQVVKITSNHGTVKNSFTRYPSTGTIVRTSSEKKK